ncbi:MAG: hypothetical protein U9O94_11695 [Nanoarchaeota archaeon]|nr:hypothetical protein [Nanoarchaeota archaeon]
MERRVWAKSIVMFLLVLTLTSVAYAAECTGGLHLELSNPNPVNGGPNFMIYLYDTGCSGFPPPGNCWDGYTTATLDPLQTGLNNLTASPQNLDTANEAPIEWEIDGSSDEGSYDLNITLDDGVGGTCTANISFSIASSIPDPNIRIGIPQIPRLIIGQPYSMTVEFNNTGSGGASNINGTVRDVNSIVSVSDSSFPTSSSAGTNTTKTYTVTPNTGGNSTMKIFPGSYYKQDSVTKVIFGAANFYLTGNNVSFYVNREPIFINNIDSAIDFSEDNVKTLNLNNHVRDGSNSGAIGFYEDATSDIIWNYTLGSGTIDLNMNLDLGADQFIITPPGNESGYRIVTFNVTDSHGTSTLQQVEITVAGVNDLPDINCTIPDQSKNEDDGAWSLDLSGCKLDVEDILENNDPSLLNWSVEGVDTSLFNAAFSDDIITFTPVADSYGSDAITLRLTDSEGAAKTQSITVTLAAVNDAPTLQAIADQQFNEGDNINITTLVDSNDVDGDALNTTYSSINPRANTNLAGDGLWNTAFNDSGKYLIKVTVDDGEFSASQEFDLTINNVAQGTNDTTNGGLNDVKSSYPNTAFEFNSVEYDGTQILSGTLPVKIKDKDNGQTIVEFDWNFSNAAPFNFNSIIINSSVQGGMQTLMVRGIDLTPFGYKKTVYMNRTNESVGSVCVKDVEIDDISDVTSDCSGASETKVYCSGGDYSGYTCTLSGTMYKITGLIHSGIRQIDYTPSVNGGDQTPSSGGGGGSTTRTTICTPTWQCTDWSACQPNGKSTRTCVDARKCGTEVKPVEERTCFYFIPSDVEESVEEEKPEIIVEEKIVEESIESEEEKGQITPILGGVIRVAGLMVPKNQVIGWGIVSGIIILGLLIYQFGFRARLKGKGKKYNIQFK